MLTRELMPHRLPHAVDVASPQDGVRTREVDVLEHALQAGRGPKWLERGRAALIDHDDLTGIDVAHHRRFHEIQRAGLRREQPGIAETAERQGTKARWITNADD